jgi:capsular polysaccharide transport system permease protein
LPSNVRALLLWNPVLHGVELVRDGWFRAYDSHYASPPYLAAWVLSLALAGLVLERLTRRKIEAR